MIFFVLPQDKQPWPQNCHFVQMRDCYGELFVFIVLFNRARAGDVIQLIARTLT